MRGLTVFGLGDFSFPSSVRFTPLLILVVLRMMLTINRQINNDYDDNNTYPVCTALQTFANIKFFFVKRFTDIVDSVQDTQPHKVN